jgi:hypothetical protein
MTLYSPSNDALCTYRFIDALQAGVDNIFIDNTNCSVWEYLIYRKLAPIFGYQ